MLFYIKSYLSCFFFLRITTTAATITASTSTAIIGRIGVLSPVFTLVVPLDGGVLSDGVSGTGVAVGSGAGVLVIFGVGVSSSG